MTLEKGDEKGFCCNPRGATSSVHFTVVRIAAQKDALTHIWPDQEIARWESKRVEPKCPTKSLVLNWFSRSL